ncbi:uncharacterized protein LOC128965373 [Oppia nitens]|uniref:uncharacterized protein LOC128965373 n=1 Tax=Oppia nitens TaxID=1686743 RepID=UPI0023D9D552|nr:uncharacterized protein LOC128965373 [Oppia nitens]XP_054168029.1 uncharacterized protein LOC128965373 [Oppia nitens]
MARGGRGGRCASRTSPRGSAATARTGETTAADTPRPATDGQTPAETLATKETTNGEEVDMNVTTEETTATPKEVKVDRRKPQLKAKTEPEPEPKPSSPAKRGGRWTAKRGRVSSSVAVNNSITDDDQNESVESSADGDSIRKRGRKPKEPIKDEDRYIPNTDAKKRGIMAEGSSSLRRRDQIKSKSRYSPPPFDTPKRDRSAIKFPSTTASNSRLMGSDDEEVSVSPTFKLTTDVMPPKQRKPNVGIRTPNESVVQTNENISVAKIGDGTKLVVTLPDGTNIKVDATTSSSKKVAFKGSKKVGDKSEDVEIDFDDDGAKSDPLDDDYKPSRARKKFEEIKTTTPVGKDKVINTYSRVTPKQSISQPPKQLLTISQSQLKQQLLGATPASKVTPKLVTPVTATNQKRTPASTQRRTPISSTKYIDGLPDVHECTLDTEPDSQFTKLPDKILLLHSELPLKLALSVEHEEESYLFRQIVSPMEANRYVCLLCKGIDVSYATKEEKDIISHYRSLHELEVVTANAKFSEDIVFICLPKSIIIQLRTNNNSIPLNAPCQYCGDEVRLINIENMKQHYCFDHNKEVTMIEQEEILKMHMFFYCSQCKHQSADFESHHRHMKTEHKMKSFKCKNCVLVTQDLNRLKNHFRAKHMINNSTQNMQCYYCHGLLIGIDRLNKHIQQSHMVQTGPQEFSCVACLKPCGRGKDLLTHAQNCPMAGQKDNKETKEKEDKSKAVVKQESNSDVTEAAICFLCGDEFENNEICLLHQHHVHMKWVSDMRRYSNATPQLIDPPLIKELTIDDLTPEEELRKAKVDTIVGHWCRMCDQMVKVYRLYYLHMSNYHKLNKEFQCNVSNCKAQFTSAEAFHEHMITTNHTQKTIITNPDEVFVCAYCDLYFGSDEDLVAHLITDQHINKFTASGHFHRTEPRNYKCKACHTFFGMKESYIHHLETEPHQYSCPYCGISTATPSSRRAHIQNTHPDKLQICEECNEPQSDVLAHFVSHGFAFECKKCIKKFYNREQLNAHMEVHQDPIVCNWEDCGRTITTRSMLVTHYRGHKSEFKCNVCGQAFWNVNMLNSHQRSHQAIQRIQPQNMAPQKPSPGRPSQTKTPLIQPNPIKHDGQPVKFPTPNLNTTSLKAKSPQPLGKPPQVSSTVIKCGHCSALFKSPKDLAGHKCVKTNIKHETQEVKPMELVPQTINTTAPKPAPKSRSRARTPKKVAQQQQQQQQQQPMIDLNALTAAQGIATQQDDGTQVIMILNQESGELMEITAPQGMAVSDVINSLNFVRPGEVATIPANGTTVAYEPTELTGVQQTQSQEVDNALTTIVSQSGDGSEQTIMLPANCFNEDGSLTLDEATLANLISGNGQITAPDGTTFIIDTSNN